MRKLEGDVTSTTTSNDQLKVTYASRRGDKRKSGKNNHNFLHRYFRNLQCYLENEIPHEYMTNGPSYKLSKFWDLNLDT